MNNLTRGKDTPDLPTQFIVDKLEVTRVYEDPESMNQFSRASLKDTSPAKPLFQEEDKRRTDSRTIINLRAEGSRYKDMPDHSEVFLGDFGSDTRRANNEPDWKEYNRQRRIRGKYIKFYNDGDNSIHERPITPAEEGEKRQVLFGRAKDKMSWFATSKDGRATSCGTGQKLQSDINYIVAEDFGQDLDNANYRRCNYTVALSNELPIGWYSTTDHEFAVAHYGPSPRNHYVKGDGVKNKYDGVVDGVNTQESKQAGNLKQAMVIMRSATESNKYVITEVGTSAYTQLAETQDPLIKTQIQRYVAADINSTEMDHEIVESMTAAIGNNNVGKGNEAVKAIVTFSNKQLQVDAANASGPAGRAPARLLTESDMRKQQEFKVMDYRGLLPQINLSRYKVNADSKKITGDTFESHENINYKTAEVKRLERVEFAGDTKIREFGDIRRSVGRPENVAMTKMLNISGSTAEMSIRG